MGGGDNHGQREKEKQEQHVFMPLFALSEN